MIAEGRGSIQVIEVQVAVGVAPWLDELNDHMVKYRLSSVVPTFASEYAEVQNVAIGSHGGQLIVHGGRLPFDDGYPVGMALEPDHGFIHSEVTTWDVVLLEEALALVIEGCSLLDNGLSLIARYRRSDVEVAVELNEAIAGHELRDVGVAVGGLPVMMQFGELDDALANTDSQVTPHLLRSHTDPNNSSTSGGILIRVGYEDIDQRRVKVTLQIAEFGTIVVTGQCHSRDDVAEWRMHIMELLTPLPDILLVRFLLPFILRRAAVLTRQVRLIAVAGLGGGLSLS
jgi:hypothetical protein